MIFAVILGHRYIYLLLNFYTMLIFNLTLLEIKKQDNILITTIATIKMRLFFGLGFFFLLPKSVFLLVSGGHSQFHVTEIDQNKPKNMSQFTFNTS